MARPARLWCASLAALLWLWLPWLPWLAWLRGAAGQCAVQQWACRGGGCIAAQRYCDGRGDCADGSDEPARCTPCNRTYYGLAGAEHELALPAAPPLPFLCQLTFTAGGGALGDLVQLTFDEFRVGRFVGGASEPCPDGFLSLAELGRPFTGGAWCGAADGAASYYSETSTVTASLKLARARLGEPLALRLRYRFLAARDAVVRYGPPAAPLERGAVSPGTYCTRTFEECHRKPCRLQSPNYPGMYPRNVSCYWSLRQKDVPTCKHAMLSIRQEHAHKMQIKRSIGPASMNKTGRMIRAWGACSGERDRLIVYDGGSTDDPVLLEYCGGGWLPRVTARTNEMLVAFHASPRPAPPRAAPRAALRGFELDVDVIFADSDSLDYAREARRCEFHVKASSSEDELNSTAAGPAGSAAGSGSGRGRRGVLRAPRHTLPPGTTCSWTFHGRPDDLVWIYFSSFSSYSLAEARRGDSGEREQDRERPTPRALPVSAGGGAGGGGQCAVEVRLWDGEAGAGAPLVQCDTAPALCARAALANATRAPRPCAPPDGHASRGALLALAVRTRPGTAVHPLGFLLHYEFVDTRLDGEPWGDGRAEPPGCARIVRRGGAVASPRNVLWFGRGGALRLRCVYRLQAAGGRGAALRLDAAAFGRRPRCVTRPHALTGQPSCAPLPPEGEPPAPAPASEEDRALSVPHLLLWESPWAGVRVPLGCVCDAAGAEGLQARGAALEIELAGPQLEPREDHRWLHWRGSWHETEPLHCAQRRRLAPPGQHLHFVYPYDSDEESECGATPYLLWARGNRSLLVRVWGSELTMPLPGAEPAHCHTTNRLLLYDADTSRLLKTVCPGEEGAGEVRLLRGGGGEGGGVSLVWRGREAGRGAAAWMEVWRGARAAGGDNATAGCGAAAAAAACPTLGLCMPAALWCDGREDCPGGGDERRGCGARARLLAAWRAHGLAAGAAAGAAGAVLLLAALLLLLLRHRRRKAPARDELLASRASSAAS